MKQPFNKDTLQDALFRAGVTPRDFELVLPCHVTTMYTYLKTGSSRRMATYTFEKIYDFLFDAMPADIFPIGGNSESRRNFIKRAFTYWSTHESSLVGFAVATPTEAATTPT